MSDTTPVLFGAHTEAARQNFTVESTRFPLEVVHDIARIKAAASAVLADVVPDRFPAAVADAIGAAAEEITEGRWDDQFVLDVFQTGSGTATHMNVNEVIAGRARELLPGTDIHPNDQVNLGQSSNDVMPTAVRMAALRRLDALDSALARLEREIGLKQINLGHVVKAGRTHMRDAVPVTLGQEFGGYRQQIVDARARLAQVRDPLGRVPLGGTAVGNGLNAPVGFADEAIRLLAERTALPLRPADDRFALQGAHDDLVDCSSRVRTAAISLQKIANDVRLLSSGPSTGLGEIELPALEPGSSIMPAKVNPVAVEVVNQVVARVIGNDATVAFAGSQGMLELNTYLPVIAHDLLESMTLLAAAADDFGSTCVAGIVPDVERCQAYAARSPARATALTPLIGYEAAVDAVESADRTGAPLAELVAERHGLVIDEVEERIDLLTMALGTTRFVRPDLPFEDPHVPSELLEPGQTGAVGPSAPS